MEWRTERQVCRENAKLKSREGRRDLGIGEESRDEVRPSETANALPGMAISGSVGMVQAGVVGGWLLGRTPGVMALSLGVVMVWAAGCGCGR